MIVWFLIKRKVLQQIYHSYALVTLESCAHPGMNPSLGLGKEGPTSHRIKGYPQPLEGKIEILVA